MFKRNILIAILFVTLIAILPVSAEDANSNGVLLANEIISADDLQITQEDALSTTHSVVGNTFDDIQNTIDNANEGDTIELSGEYIGNGTEIKIDKSLDINAKENTFLDANKTSSIFCISGGKNIILRGLTILNSGGSAIYSSQQYSFVCFDCTFINNTGVYGGAISYGSAVNCTFINNTASRNGGALSFGDAINCTFVNNTVNSYHGGAMSNGKAVNCTFITNYAGWNGGATIDVDALNCTFIGNSAHIHGGAMIYGDAVNCTFIRNNAGSEGGAMKYGDAVTCKFLINHDGNGDGYGSFLKYGDALCFGTAVYCYFEGNEKPRKVYSNMHTNVYCHGEFSLIAQSGQYYKDKWLTIELMDIDSNLPLNDESIEIRFSNGISVNVTTNSSGIATYLVPFEYGTYNATFSVNSKYISAADARLDNIVIKKVPADLKLTSVGQNYGDVTLTLTLSNSDRSFSNEDIVITFSNGKSVRLTTDSQGSATYSIPFEPGIYGASASLISDSIIVEDVKLNNIIIRKAPADLEINSTGETYGNVTLTLTFTSSDAPVPGEIFEISFSDSDSIDVITDINGIATCPVSLIPGTYLITAKLVSDCYDTESKSITVKILKTTPKLTASKKTFKLTAKTKKYAVTLKDSDGRVIKNAKVTLKVNGKTYSARTDAKGKATFNINKLTKKGSFKSTITYSGSNYYNKVTKTVTITVKK